MDPEVTPRTARPGEEAHIQACAKLFLVTFKKVANAYTSKSAFPVFGSEHQPLSVLLCTYDLGCVMHMTSVLHAGHMRHRLGTCATWASNRWPSNHRLTIYNILYIIIIKYIIYLPAYDVCLCLIRKPSTRSKRLANTSDSPQHVQDVVQQCKAQLSSGYQASHHAS